jgi:catechol 2,3-dioxygenase-like lactoylglutathione lyase family enzyme
MFDHVTLQVADVRASADFYEAVLAPLGIALVVDEGPVAGFFGPDGSGFWLCPAQRDQDRELHLAFRAANREQVRAFHQVAVNFGAEVLHEPQIFPEYDPFYFGAFVRDLDGHNIEAVCKQPE